MYIKTKNYKINNKYTIVCSTSETRSGCKRHSIEVLKDNIRVDKEIGIKDSSKANEAFKAFVKKYSGEVV